MKKIALAFIIVVVFAYGAMCATPSCNVRVDRFTNNPNVAVITYDCTAAADGSFVDTPLIAADLAKVVGFYITEVQVYPGTPNPTALYDMTYKTARGLDMLMGNGANRSASANERVLPLAMPPPIVNSPTLALTNNSVNGAKVIFQFILGK